ncbi:hypothetical protein LSAT2_006839 [Lamellibrachia satsuma]|nr:hypothetical protein LSAT2_006839 [Lamellibrachia satsuma]
MFAPFSSALLLAVLCVVQADFGDFPSPKWWWAKRISAGLFTAGRLTDRQIKYAADGGFKTLISLTYYHRSGRVMGEVVPSTPVSRHIAVDLAGVHFVSLPCNGRSLLQWINDFSGIVEAAQPPVLVYDRVGKVASFLALAHLAKKTGMNNQEVLDRGAALGYSFSSRTFQRTLARVTGSRKAGKAPKLSVSLPRWTKLWALKPVYKNWYVSGQLQANHIPLLSSIGFDAIINCRNTLTRNSPPINSQEEVNLLNVKSFTGTYRAGGRQSTARLMETRVDEARANEYVRANSPVNYECRNSREFGDNIGYNEPLEQRAADRWQLDYYNTPVIYNTSEPVFVYSVDNVDQYMDAWMEAGVFKNVVVHCFSGYRAAQVAVLGAAIQYGLSYDWAAQRLIELGFRFDKEEGQPALKMLETVLGSRRELACDSFFRAVRKQSGCVVV